MMRASLVLLVVLVAVVAVLALGSYGLAQEPTFLASVATEMGNIEDDVRTGMVPAIAGLLTALVLIAVGISVVSFFTRSR